MGFFIKSVAILLVMKVDRCTADALGFIQNFITQFCYCMLEFCSPNFTVKRFSILLNYQMFLCAGICSDSETLRWLSALKKCFSFWGLWDQLK